MRLSFSAVLLAAVAFFTAAAHADTAYTFTFSGTDISGSGTFTLADTTDPNAFLVTSISGEINGTAITSLLPTGNFHNNDNLFYNSADYLDSDGVGFQLANNAQVAIYYVNEDWFFVGDGSFTLEDGGTQVVTTTPLRVSRFSFAPADVAATPEPAGFALVATGIFGTAGMVRRRFRA